MIINPSRSFDGADIGASDYGRIIKDGVRTISFRDDKNKQTGNYFFILPPFKVDTQGNGVWYKVVPVRKDFGVEKRESFVPEADCPVAYFENQCRIRFPDYCQIEDVVVNGNKRKRYPTFGRTTKIVLYNSAYVNEMNLGAHILTVPVHYVGQTIEAWGRSKDSKGNLRQMVNDPTGATPIKLQLRKDVSGNPWFIEIDPTERYEIPNTLADSDYLYNLDDAIFITDKEYLVNKLRSITPAEIFDVCMKGFLKPNFQGADVEDDVPMTYPSAKAPVKAPTQIAPAFEAPKASIPVQAPSVSIPTAPIPREPTQKVAGSANPFSSGSGMSIQDAQAYLKQKKG